MKLLASDYDGTLKYDVKSLKINIDYIKQFRKKGHKFAITTGRTFNSIKKQISMYNIPYDYLSCNDGSILFNNKNEILDVKYLNIPNIELLIERLSKLYITKQVATYGLYDKTNSLENVLEIFVKTKLFAERELITNLIKDYQNVELLSILNHNYIESAGGKSRSIAFLNKIYHFDEIITVGDGINDYGMLKEYNGYKMFYSTPSLYLSGIKTTTSVKSLIKKHL